MDSSMRVLRRQLRSLQGANERLRDEVAKLQRTVRLFSLLGDVRVIEVEVEAVDTDEDDDAVRTGALR